PELLTACRSILPEPSVQWLDAAYVLTSDGAKYPPLFGTGGNDGNLEFTNNFMQRVSDLIDAESGAPTPSSKIWLKASLFGTETDGLQRSAIGQFHPSAAGGSNQSAGFDSNTQMNPWDYVLMIEGALLFAGATVKKLETVSSGALSYPFSVRS